MVKVATLDAETREPTRDEAKELGLKLEVRTRGQIVSDVDEDGAASKSGIAEGDVIVTLAGVDIFSRDDIADILRVSAPGQKVQATVLRAKTGKEGAMPITLGLEELEPIDIPELAWDYASLANLKSAVARAKASKKPVLVGLSGAET